MKSTKRNNWTLAAVSFAVFTFVGWPVGLAGQNVVVVLDDSGSMSEPMRSQRNTNKIEAAKSALLTVLESLPSDAQVGVVLLNGRVNRSPWAIPLGAVDLPHTRQAMSAVRAKGSTPLGQYMKIGADELLKLRGQQHYGEYRLLIVTDGEATDRRLVQRFLPDVMSRGITVDVIGVDMAAQHSLATQVHSYRRADDPDSLTAAIREVFAETPSDQPRGTAESDFELLEGLPSEVARAALVALAASGDQPIGERPATGDRPDGVSDMGPANPAAPLPGPDPAPQPVRPRFGIWLVLIIVLLVAYNVIRIALRGVRQR